MWSEWPGQGDADLEKCGGRQLCRVRCGVRNGGRQWQNSGLAVHLAPAEGCIPGVGVWMIGVRVSLSAM